MAFECRDACRGAVNTKGCLMMGWLLRVIVVAQTTGARYLVSPCYNGAANAHQYQMVFW